MQNGERKIPAEARERTHIWPPRLAVAVLGACGVATVLVSDWFVAALDPAIERLGISQAFAGLVVVAIAGNTVGVVEIRLALQGKADLALSAWR